MRPGRELDTFIAQNVLGHPVKVRAKQLWEVTPLGERPLQKYSREIACAWEVVEKMGITIIPVEDGQWFAFVGTGQPWKNPAQFIEFLAKANFQQSGAAVGENPAEVICVAASKALDKISVRENAESSESCNPQTPLPDWDRLS